MKSSHSILEYINTLSLAFIIVLLSVMAMINRSNGVSNAIEDSHQKMHIELNSKQIELNTKQIELNTTLLQILEREKQK